MLFNSSVFILVFLPITLFVLYCAAGRGLHRASTAWLVLASCVFYGWFSVKLLGLLGLSIVFNFWLGRKLARDHARVKHNGWLVFGLVVNLGVLAYFKYANFLIDNTNMLLGAHFAVQNIVLPIGISFFTFQKIAFLVDCHRGEAEEYDFLSFSLFVMYFPQLIAGPIVHHKELIPQIRNTLAFRFSYPDFAGGAALFIMGLAKKILFADKLAGIADPIFAAAKAGSALGAMDAWLGAITFTFQIYFDFSGYTDMALGLAMMTGIRLPVNFDSPYKATSIIDFWRRWHISLSRFIRDYIYFPLGGGRQGDMRRAANLLAAMLLGGLWHGAAWTFVAWGGLHGLCLIVNHLWRTRRSDQAASSAVARRLSVWGARGLTFFVVVVAWVVFRADGFPAAMKMLEAMTATQGGLLPVVPVPMGTRKLAFFLAALLAWVWFMPNSQELLRHLKPALYMSNGDDTSFSLWRPVLSRLGIVGTDGALSLNALTGCCAATALLGLLAYQSIRSTTLLQFIYFQF